MDMRQLIRVIQAQTVLIRELAGLEQRMLLALLKKDSAEAQACQENYAELSSHIERAEDIRLSIIRHLANLYGIVSHPGSEIPPKELFARLEARLEISDREEIKTAMAHFRSACLELAAVNRSLSAYTGAQLVTLDGFLTELLPSRRDEIYGSDGRQRSSSRPQLLNTHV